MDSSNQSSWKPGIVWHKVSIEAYQVIYEQAKERYEDIMSESESITNKSIKMILALTAFTGFILDFIIRNQFQVNVLVYCLAPIILCDVWLLYRLILPKHITNRGLPPDLTINKDLDDDENRNHQLALTYYTSITLIQRNIYFMIDKNASRAKKYRYALTLFLIVFIASSAIVLNYI